jgi:hypothetical protein
VLITAEEALQLAFPQAQVEKQQLFLSAPQKAAVEKKLGRPVPGLWVRYRVHGQGQVLAWAYLDTHRVRTLPETLLVVVGQGGQVLRVEVLAFAEPPEYRPREEWYRQFRATGLSQPPQLGKNLRPVTGATLTAQATAEAVRRVLAVHEVVGP